MSMQMTESEQHLITGEFLTLDGERYYAIANVDRMEPFFISLVSDSDHWMFVSSNGGLTAGRVSPETALFPYVTVDKIHDSTADTGSKTVFRVHHEGELCFWEPMNRAHDHRYALQRNLYKNALGDKLLFEEINFDLQLRFRYRWVSSARYGFSRQCELTNLGSAARDIDMLDGLQNILPAGTPRFTQTNSSCLVDAYKWNEVDTDSGLGLFTLFSGISDRAEPCESLRANTVFCLGLKSPTVVLSMDQYRQFLAGHDLIQETHKRGIRGAYCVSSQISLDQDASCEWQLVADTELSQARVVHLQQELQDPDQVKQQIADSVRQGSDALARILASSDGFQLTGEENVATHHTANVLFNLLRGGIFDDQYRISKSHFLRHVRAFNRSVFDRHQTALNALPERFDSAALLVLVAEKQDTQLQRLAYEYLPICFGRRHGDPSRPWNQFAIQLTNEHGQRLLSYQGNWRDIFQNWEALLVSYPEFIEHSVAKFVNASTIDGYNPYRITDQGIDWEVEDPEDPWSYIGYWGDHQVIYLQKLLELSHQFHPGRLAVMLRSPLFSYANVPYRIKPFAALLENPKNTIEYAEEEAVLIDRRVESLGADGRLLLDGDGEVYQVSLMEKLLVMLLAKLSNLVIDGGIWLNTQRPEWNDANNALVGQGLSMVTLFYMRRCIAFLQRLLENETAGFPLSWEVCQWLQETAAVFATIAPQLRKGPVDAAERYRILRVLGESASRYRESIYSQRGFSGSQVADAGLIKQLFEDAQLTLDSSIGSNLRTDGLFNAYNLLDLRADRIEVEALYPMLEGQVAALSSGAMAPQAVAELLKTVVASELFRPDQQSYLLYPDRALPGFLEKNCVPAEAVAKQPLLQAMMGRGDQRVVEQDVDGRYRFHADLTNAGELELRLNELESDYDDLVRAARQPLYELYEEVFNHRAFTGRSGGMFGFEGLGSIYWHMVAKFLLAAQECYFAAVDQGADAQVIRELGLYYYEIRRGIGFNKTPGEYGAFPTDPYSHTPMHSGAQQPGMTGQVKEEILTRFGELGLRVRDGAVQFEPRLLRHQEFISEPLNFRYLDVFDHWQKVLVPAATIAFTWCQVPFVYRLHESADPRCTVIWGDGTVETHDTLALPAATARQLFERSGAITQIELDLCRDQLFE